MTRQCANGKGCVAVPALGQPARLSRANAGDVCFACAERDLDDQVYRAPPLEGEERHTVAEAAALVEITVEHAYYLIACGELRVERPGLRQILVPESEVARHRRPSGHPMEAG